MVASWYSSSTGWLARPKACSRRETTPGSRSRISQPAVRTKVFQYSGSSTKVRYWSRLAAYSPGPTRACNDSSNSSTCGRITSPTSHSSAGANSKPSIQRRWVATSLMASSRETPGLGRLVAEVHGLAGLQVSEAPGERQCDVQRRLALVFQHQHGGVAAIEQHALHARAPGRLARGQLARAAPDLDGFGPDEQGGRLANVHRTHTLRPQPQAAGRAQQHLLAVARFDRAFEAVVVAHETRNERGLRLGIQLLRRAQLFEAAVVHHRDLVRHDQRFRLVVRDVDEGGADLGLELFQLHLHVLTQFQIQRAQRFVEH